MMSGQQLNKRNVLKNKSTKCRDSCIEVLANKVYINKNSAFMESINSLHNKHMKTMYFYNHKDINSIHLWYNGILWPQQGSHMYAAT